MARRPDALDLPAAVDRRRFDALDPGTLPAALAGARFAYYLLHSMGRGSSGDFSELDRRAATNFAAAAAAAGIERIIYLGGLGTGESKHLISRHETALRLASQGVPVTYLRAAVVIGAGSESFRTIVALIKRLPAMITPRWVNTRTQPIAARDVVRYLAGAPAIAPPEGGEIQIGGPDVTTYGGMMDAAARALEIQARPRIVVPLLSPRLSSLWVGLVTPIDPQIARPLIDGLSVETVVTDPSGMALYDFEPCGLDQAMREAVG